MYYLNRCLLTLCKAYKSDDFRKRSQFVKSAIKSLHQAQAALDKKEHGVFRDWYDGDRVFGFDGLFKTLAKIDT